MKHILAPQSDAASQVSLKLSSSYRPPCAACWHCQMHPPLLLPLLLLLLLL
jgi:hypothetical protein